MDNWKVTIELFPKYGEAFITLKDLMILVSGKRENLVLIFYLSRDDDWAFKRERKGMGVCRPEWVAFLGLCLGPRELLKGDPVEKIGFR